MKRKKGTPQRLTQSNARVQQDPQMFADHLQELKGRIFWVVMAFLISSAAAYPFFDKIIKIITAPLGEHELYYLTPAGGLSFMFKVCMYVGVLGVLPVAIYQFYKFIVPVMNKHHSRAVVKYTIASTLLAASGIAFAYFVSMPAALNFLTGIEINGISSMLTIDAYVSFVSAYIIAGALLFQLPLIMLIIDSITPLKPQKLMSFQRHIIVGSFVLGAILSPTPDMINQTIMAAPVIAMYQLAVAIIWFKHRKRAKKMTRNLSRGSTLPIAASIDIHDDDHLKPRLSSLADIERAFFADMQSAYDMKEIERPKNVINSELRNKTPIKNLNQQMQSSLSQTKLPTVSPSVIQSESIISEVNRKPYMRTGPSQNIVMEKVVVNSAPIESIQKVQDRRVSPNARMTYLSIPQRPGASMDGFVRPRG